MIAIALLAPTKCYEHPIDKQCMKGRPEITCGEGPHTVLMVLSMLALMMYPVACFGITIIATGQFPKGMDKQMTLACWFVAITFSTGGSRSATGLQSLL